METPERPLDFTVLLRLRRLAAVADLQAGADSARRAFPVSACRIERDAWVTPRDLSTMPAVARAADEDERRSMVARFVDAPLDPTREPPVRQVAILDSPGPGLLLATRVHHAAADGLSALLWIAHELEVAAGVRAPHTAGSGIPLEPAIGAPALRQHRSPTRRSRFAFPMPADPSWTRAGVPARPRRWLTRSLAAEDLGRTARAIGVPGFHTLAAAFLDALTTLAQEREPGRPRRLGLWMPVDIRRIRGGGFGNGTSRVRVYARWRHGLPLAATAADVALQFRWSLRHGEWAVPRRHILLTLRGRLQAWALRAYLRRPWVDMGSAVFTLVERSPLDAVAESVASQIDGVEGIGLLHRRHPVGLSGLVHRGTVWLTYTYDPVLLDASDVAFIADTVDEQIAAARNGPRRAGDVRAPSVT
jgi:hypothetical protein